jgi:hypothetical protein
LVLRQGRQMSLIVTIKESVLSLPWLNHYQNFLTWLPDGYTLAASPMIRNSR